MGVLRSAWALRTRVGRSLLQVAQVAVRANLKAPTKAGGESGRIAGNNKTSFGLSTTFLHNSSTTELVEL